MTNKLQPLPCKVPEKFIEGCGDYSVIFVLHGTFVSRGCLFKIHEFTGLCSRLNLNWTWYSIIYFIRIDEYGIGH